MNLSVYRFIIGIFSLLFLAAAGFFWLTDFPDEEKALMFYGFCCRAGVMLFLVWLAWKYLVKIPPWMLTGLPVILIAGLINLKLLSVAIPLYVIITVLMRPTKKNKKRKKT